MENTPIFDSNNMALIGAFLNLKDKCYYYENFFLGEAFFNINKNNYKFIYYHSFYSLFRDICDISLFFVINEEISNAHGRDYFPKLLQQVISSDHYVASKKHRVDNDSLDYVHTYNELCELLINKYNQSLGSQMLDFHVAAFSSFENWINKLYLNCYPKHRDDLVLHRQEKIRKAIIKYHEDPTDKTLTSSIKKIFDLKGDFISFPDKVNELCKLMLLDSYTRDLKFDKRIISFLGKIRNTVHNSGVHLGSNDSITFNNAIHSIEHGKPYHTSSWLESIKLLGELVEIYTAILESMPDRTNFIESFIKPELDEMTFKILNITLNDFINGKECSDTPNLLAEDLCNFLVNRLKLNRNQALRITSALKSMEQPLSEEQLLVFLAHDFNN